MITLQPVIDNIVEQLRRYYQNESLPLCKNARTQANMAARFLDISKLQEKLDEISARLDQQQAGNIFAVC